MPAILALARLVALLRPWKHPGEASPMQRTPFSSAFSLRGESETFVKQKKAEEAPGGRTGKRTANGNKGCGRVTTQMRHNQRWVCHQHAMRCLFLSFFFFFFPFSSIESLSLLCSVSIQPCLAWDGFRQMALSFSHHPCNLRIFVYWHRANRDDGEKGKMDKRGESRGMEAKGREKQETRPHYA
ncbi:hypothetical protein V8C35DRAFT_212374 [Trichoderma chlorosporum]